MSTEHTSLLNSIEAWETKAREAWMSGDFTRSRQLFERTLHAYQELGATAKTIYAHIHVTQAMRFEDNFPAGQARLHLEEAMRLAKQLEPDWYVAPIQANLPDLALDEGEYAKALSLAQHCLELWKHFSDPDGTCHLLETSAMALAGLVYPCKP